LSCHHSKTFCKTLSINLTTFAQWCWNFLQTSFRHFFAICIKLCCSFLFSFYLLLCYVVLPSLHFCNVHFCFVNIFVLFKFFLLFVPMSFVDWSSLYFLHVHFHHPLDYWPIGPPFCSSFTLTLQHVFDYMLREILSKIMASFLGNGLTSVQLLHTFFFSFVEFLNWNFAFKRI
jgi:hypothetical protein